MGAKTDVSSVLPVATHNIEQRFMGLSEWLDVVRDDTRTVCEQMGRELGMFAASPNNQRMVCPRCTTFWRPCSVRLLIHATVFRSWTPFRKDRAIAILNIYPSTVSASGV